MICLSAYVDQQLCLYCEFLQNNFPSQKSVIQYCPGKALFHAFNCTTDDWNLREETDTYVNKLNMNSLLKLDLKKKRYDGRFFIASWSQLWLLFASHVTPFFMWRPGYL